MHGARDALATPARAQSTVILAFLPAGEAELAGARGMSVGILSASQGNYSSPQLVLDLTQGARIASSAYSSAAPSSLPLRVLAGTGAIGGWRAVLARAAAAPQLLQPGLLAGDVPGGAGYAAIAGGPQQDAAAAADQSGRIAAVSLGSPATLLARVMALSRSRRLVVVDLPAGTSARRDLLTLSAERSPAELLVAVQRSAVRNTDELLWSAAAGLAGGARRELSSQSTRERGLIASIDLAPTILAHLGVRDTPSAMRGRVLEATGALRSGSLRALMSRLRVIGGRRLKALGWLLAAWAALLLLAGALPNGRAAGWRGRAIRAGAIGVMWAPVVSLLTSALEPGATLEYAIIALLCLALGALSDQLLAWPRAPLAPALAAVLALSADALARSQLLMRSLLGPDPILGARFYGIGNELKSGLAVLVLAGLAGALHPSARGRREAAAAILTGVTLAALEGSTLIGAAVGGAVLVSAGFAVAAIVLAPGALTHRRVLLALLSPLLALLALAALELATAHGSGHFTGSILHARSAADLREVFVRRYAAAWRELANHAMPAATALALLAVALGVRSRDRLLAPVAGDPAWRAALAGGLTCGVVGALVEDSGPVLLLVACAGLGCVASYLSAPTGLLSSSTPDRLRGSRSRAPRPPAARVG